MLVQGCLAGGVLGGPWPGRPFLGPGRGGDPWPFGLGALGLGGRWPGGGPLAGGPLARGASAGLGLGLERPLARGGPWLGGPFGLGGPPGGPLAREAAKNPQNHEIAGPGIQLPGTRGPRGGGPGKP